MRQQLVILLLMGFGILSCAKTEIELQAINKENNSSNAIVSIELDKDLLNSPFRLMASTASEKIEVPYQRNENEILWKTLTPDASYFIEKQAPTAHKAIKIAENEGQLEIYQNERKIIGYQMAIEGVPKGVSKAYQRSGYLHPVNTPSGKRLTRIQPKDHYHHYGIWNPWTHTLFDGDTIDFWNLNKKQGTVRFSKLLNKVTGPVFSEFEVLHEHVVLKDEKNTIALNEIQNIRIFPMDEKRYLIDLKISYQCATDKAFKIIKYRYGGLGWRTTEVWDNQNSRILTSEGKTRKNADGSTARWCIVDGQLENAYGGVLLLSHPQNYNHPEPLRIWPEDQYERGDLFVNFATTKTKDWILNPGETYELNYRLIVYDGKMDTESAEKAWNQFVNPLQYELKP